MGRFREWTRGNVETREPWTGGLSANSIADSLCLNFLVYFAEISSYFPMKTNKRKVWKRRFDLANGKYLSLFLEVFARMVKVTHFAQVINFPKRAQVKIHLRKVDKNNREYTFSYVVVFFSTQQKNKVYCPFFKTTAKTKSLLPLLFCSLCFSNGLFTHALAKGADQIIKQAKQSENGKQTSFERL